MKFASSKQRAWNYRDFAAPEWLAPAPVRRLSDMTEDELRKLEKTYGAPIKHAAPKTQGRCVICGQQLVMSPSGAWVCPLPRGHR